MLHGIFIIVTSVAPGKTSLGVSYLEYWEVYVYF